MLALDGKLASIILLFLVFVSFFGLALALVVAAIPPKGQDDSAIRKPLVGSALGLVCVLGILAALHPDSCTGIIGFKNRGKTVHSFREPRAEVMRGHHVACEPYSTHVLKIGNRALCATCSGLLVGAVIVLVGTCWFFFGSFPISGEPLVLVSLGAAGVVGGLLYAVVPSKFQTGFTRFLAGLLLPIGTFFIVAGVESASESLSSDLFFVALSVLWLSTKMSLSRWEHRGICERCSLGLCSTKFTS